MGNDNFIYFIGKHFNVQMSKHRVISTYIDVHEELTTIRGQAAIL